MKPGLEVGPWHGSWCHDVAPAFDDVACSLARCWTCAPAGERGLRTAARQVDASIAAAAEVLLSGAAPAAAIVAAHLGDAAALAPSQLLQVRSAPRRRFHALVRPRLSDAPQFLMTVSIGSNHQGMGTSRLKGYTFVAVQFLIVSL